MALRARLPRAKRGVAGVLTFSAVLLCYVFLARACARVLVETFPDAFASARYAPPWHASLVSRLEALNARRSHP